MEGNDPRKSCRRCRQRGRQRSRQRGGRCAGAAASPHQAHGRLISNVLQLAALLRTPAAQPHLQGVHSSCCAHLAAPAL